MSTLFALLIWGQSLRAADFCTVIAFEEFHEFNKTYKLKVLNHSCTDGSSFDFKEELHTGVQTWSDGHRKYFPAYSSQLLKTVSKKGYQFRTSSNRESNTTFFFHKD